MAEKKVPLRQCLGCGERKTKKELIRVIRTPQGAIELDFTGRKNGRGAYLCNCAECLGKARKKNTLARALKQEVSNEIYDQLLAQMEQNFR